MSDTPSVFGFVKEIGPWLTPILGVLLGKAMKSGVNESNLNKVIADVASQQIVMGNHASQITTNNVRIELMEKSVNRIGEQLEEMNRLLGELVGGNKLRDSGTYRIRDRDRL